MWKISSSNHHLREWRGQNNRGSGGRNDISRKVRTWDTKLGRAREVVKGGWNKIGKEQLVKSNVE